MTINYDSTLDKLSRDIGAEVTSFRHVTCYLDTNGDGTGTKNAVGNYTSPTEFYRTPGTNKILDIGRMFVSIADAPASTISVNKYGDLNALTNGVKIEQKQDTTVITDFTDSLPVKDNGNWGTLAYDLDLKDFGVANVGYIHSRLSFSRFGKLLRLDDRNNDRLVATLNDNFTGLIHHFFVIEGIEYTIKP